MELSRYNKYAAGLSTSPFSGYDHEKEIIFFGSDAVFRINSIFQWYNRKWLSYRKSLDGIQSLLNVANGTITWNETNNMKHIIGYILPDLYFSNKLLSEYVQKLVDYHLKNVPNIIEYDFEEINMDKQPEWVKDTFVRAKNIPNIANLCNVFVDSDNIIVNMPSIDLMNDDCCKSVVDDLLNVINENAVIKLQWKSPKPLQLIDIQAAITKHAKKISTHKIEAYVDEEKVSFITITKQKKIKMEFRSFAPLKVLALTENIVNCFVRESEREMDQTQNKYKKKLSTDIVYIISIFYECHLRIPIEESSPFSILFAIFDLQSVLSIKGWEILESKNQCEYLKDNKIDGIDKRKALVSDLVENIYQFSNITQQTKSRIDNQILSMLSLYNQKRVFLKNNKTDYAKWSEDDVIISFICYLVNAATISINQNLWSIFVVFVKMHNMMAPNFILTRKIKLIQDMGIFVNIMYVKCMI